MATEGKIYQHLIYFDFVSSLSFPLLNNWKFPTFQSVFFIRHKTFDKIRRKSHLIRIKHESIIYVSKHKSFHKTRDRAHIRDVIYFHLSRKGDVSIFLEGLPPTSLAIKLYTRHCQNQSTFWLIQWQAKIAFRWNHLSFVPSGTAISRIVRAPVRNRGHRTM